MTGALATEGLVVELGGRPVVDGVDLLVEPGEWVGLIGPNGAGKSSLLRALAGVVPSDGRRTVGDRVPEATDLAMVPQSPVLPVGMTVAEYVLVGRTAHLGWLARESAHDREAVGLVLERLELGEFAHRQVVDLSGGEAQRVVVARALAQDTPFVLLDEPTSALDIGHQSAVLELMEQLRREDGIGVLAAMHELGTAARYADRLVLMHHGRVHTRGTPDEVLTDEVLSEVYDTEVTVHRIDDELVVLPTRRQVLAVRSANGLEVA